MSNNQEEKKENKDQQPQQISAREAMAIERDAINTLQQIGVSVKIPLRRHDFVRRGLFTLFREKVSEKPNIKALPGEVEIVKTQLPDPNAPQNTVEVQMADVRIRPLFADTIDMIRLKFLDMALAEKDIMQLIEEKEGCLLKYGPDMHEILAIATINDGPRAKKKDIEAWREFYRSHLTNQRLFHLTKIVIAMLDDASFVASIRLVAGIGTTAPRSTKRIEKETSKD